MFIRFIFLAGLAAGFAAAAPAVAQKKSQPDLKAVPSTQPGQGIPGSPAAALNWINVYLNSIDQLTASFVQTSPGGRSTGTLFLKRPGQLQFAYAPPSSLEVVSDGRSVAVRDRKLRTNDVYPIGQTPLKFLIQDEFDLARDTKLRDVQVSPGGIITVRFDDSSTFGGTSKIVLQFDVRSNRLKQWTIVDPQGVETTVVLSNINVVRRQDA